MNQKTVEHILYEEVKMNGEINEIHNSIENVDEYTDPLDQVKHIIFRPIKSAQTYNLYYYSNDILYSPELETVYVMDKLYINNLVDILRSYAEYINERFLK